MKGQRKDGVSWFVRSLRLVESRAEKTIHCNGARTQINNAAESKWSLSGADATAEPKSKSRNPRQKR